MNTSRENIEFTFVDDVGVKWAVTCEGRNLYRLYEWMRNQWHFRRVVKNIATGNDTLSELDKLKLKTSEQTKQ